MKTAHVIFKNPDYNYITRVNEQLPAEEIKSYFEGGTFNLGGMSYDHEKDQEVEIDNLQKCIKCYVSEFETGATNYGLNDLILWAENTPDLCEKLDNIYTKILDGGDPEYLLKQFFIDCKRSYMGHFGRENSKHIATLTREDLVEWVHLYQTGLKSWKFDHATT